MGITERGSVTAYVAVMAIGLLFCVGLVVDGGRRVASVAELTHLADNAARAAAQAIDEDSVRAGTPRLDPVAANAAAASYLSGSGVTFSVAVTGVGDTVRVDLTRSVEPAWLPVATFTARASGTAGIFREAP
jgi:Flp pilus assembly protein TadG